MTPDEAGLCVRRLAATFGGEWAEDRVSVWVEVLLPHGYGEGVEAIKAMAFEDDYPTIAGLNRHLNPQRQPGVIVAGDRRFLPGTGWISSTQALTP
jgi:hypothetical protein